MRVPPDLGARVVFLTGAGLSAPSGLPTYRGPDARPPRDPITGAKLRDDPAVRQRYWARAAIGWTRFSKAAPNAGHHAIAALEAAGRCVGVITQNVDRLHHAAGSRAVIELHGALAHARCLGCGAREDRDAVQARIEALNPGWTARAAADAPDGDADVPTDALAAFVRPTCPRCGGDLRPDVVLFGENVAREVVDAAWALVDAADTLVVAGSSLTVWSGYRFAKGAKERGKRLVVVNLGPTRADELADVRIDAPCEAVLAAWASP